MGCGQFQVVKCHSLVPFQFLPFKDFDHLQLFPVLAVAGLLQFKYPLHCSSFYTCSEKIST